eukprot:COSAG05_NODE_14503_length_395_cov_0.685811_1_plen_52_part_10
MVLTESDLVACFAKRTGEIDRIESVAHKSRISLATMRRMLRLTKDILQQSLA